MNPVTLSALEIVRPGDARYDEVRPAWNLTVDQRPAAVAVPRDADQVVAAVLYAKREGLRVAAQGTGHNASPLGDLSDTLLIKTHEMRGVEIDAKNRIARVEAGALWGDVVGPAGEHGLAALAGSSHDAIGTQRAYGCIYNTARLLYSATVVADPNQPAPPKKKK
jgi:FAD/FMN-containing dehydrogenase